MFQAALADALARSGLSQDELAAKVGVRQQTVSKWVRGVAVPNQGRIRQIEQATKTPAGRLARAAQEDASVRLTASGGKGQIRPEARSRIAELEQRVEHQEAELKELRRQLAALLERMP